MGKKSEHTTPSTESAQLLRRPRAEKDLQPTGPLAAMGIRKKLLVLHTCFSLALAAIMLASLRPAVERVIFKAEGEAARVHAELFQSETPGESRVLDAGRTSVRRVTVPPSEVSAAAVARALANPGEAVVTHAKQGGVDAVLAAIDGEGLIIASVEFPLVRRAALFLYGMAVVAILSVYALVVAALEGFVLPRHVYGPIRRMLAADRAVQQGDESAEIIDEKYIPADELGEIMRSRNTSVSALRQHEKDLADALDRLESVADDLKRKNHLLETAKRNLADTDRLASLGMMSAGIAHELNTPLAVVKGLVHRMQTSVNGSLSAGDTALLVRVVGRLERLSESLLDFARAREPETSTVSVLGVVDEAVTLVRLDRELRGVRIENTVAPDATMHCDGDRMVQVFVNLIRNAVDAVRDESDGVVRIDAQTVERDGRAWASVTVRDNGPGIHPEVLPRLFEPFVTSRMDDRGTGLGLAVSEGIVREHGGAIFARNRPMRAGAEFEVLIPGYAVSEATDEMEHVE